MFTCTRLDSGAEPAPARPATSTLSTSPACAGRLELMVTLSTPETLCTLGGTTSIGMTIATVSAPFENFSTAGPAGRPCGITNVTWFGFAATIGAGRSLTVMLGFERFDPESIAAAPE